MNDLKPLAVRALHVSKSFISGESELQVLDGVNFTLTRGESAIIIGKSGSGKSTFLHLLGALDRVDSGQISVADHDLVRMSEKQLNRFRRDHVGFIFQSHYLLDDFTALENIYMPALMSGKERKDALGFAKDLLEQIGLTDRADHYPKKLSGGERQRIAVARALINDPQIVLADEPTGNLDEFNSKMIEELLFSLVETYHKSLILVTHDTSLLARGDHRYRLFLGKLEEYRQ
jgi:lipoprotein-releasing system ATP-binding protein